MEGFFDDRKNVQADIQIGRDELIKLKLDYSCDDNQKLVYELYCIPSHNEQAYYAQIFKKDSVYYISYVKSVIEDCVIGGTIYMYTLREAVKANDKNRSYGKLVCGYKKVADDNIEYLKGLFDHIPEGFHWNEDSGICIDGIFQVIRVYSDGKMLKELAFHIETESITDVEVREKLGTLNRFIEKEIIV